jgi:hypothetical protein
MEGGWNPPVILARRRWGPTYIDFVKYHTGLVGFSSSWSLTVVNVVEGPVTTQARNLLRCLQQPSTTHLVTTTSSLSCGRGIAVALSRGPSFYSCITLAISLSGGEVFSACLYLVGGPEDELWLRLCSGPWLDLSTPLAGFVYALGRVCLRPWQGLSTPLAGWSSCLWQQDLQLAGIVVLFIIYNIRNGGCLRHQRLVLGVPIH